MAIIIGIIAIIYFVLIAWTWQSLGIIEKRKKVIFILIGIFVMYIITLITFNISKKGINYQDEKAQVLIKRILVILFTGLNGIIFIPYIAKIWNKLKENNINQEQLNKKIIIFVIIFIICIAFEYGYLKDTQQGILNIYQSMIK